MSQPPYKTYDPNVDTQADLVAQLTTDNPLTLYHGTSEKKYDAVHKPKPHLSSGAKGDFGWGGTNSALYTTHSQGVADFYGRQAAETDRSARYVILKGQLNRSTVKLLEITSIPTWQSVSVRSLSSATDSDPSRHNIGRRIRLAETRGVEAGRPERHPAVQRRGGLGVDLCYGRGPT